jgi:hypothetical protein
MRTPQGPLAILLVLVLAAAPFAALPAVAVAQSAGDDQYVDPFEGDDGGGGGGGGNSNSGDGSGGGGEGDGTESGSTTSGDTTTSDATGSADPEAAAGGSGTALPTTGLPLAPLVCAGVLLLAGGALLRRRV